MENEKLIGSERLVDFVIKLVDEYIEELDMNESERCVYEHEYTDHKKLKQELMNEFFRLYIGVGDISELKTKGD